MKRWLQFRNEDQRSKKDTQQRSASEGCSDEIRTNGHPSPQSLNFILSLNIQKCMYHAVKIVKTDALNAYILDIRYDLNNRLLAIYIFDVFIFHTVSGVMPSF